MKDFDQFFYSSPVIMFLINSGNGKIEDANNAASKFYGYTKKDLKNMNISEINILDPDEIKNEMNVASSAKKNYFIFQHKLANGNLKQVEVHSTPLIIEGKKYLFSVIHDISERVKNEILLQEYTNQLKIKNADLETFAYIASHDLKNPLNVANGLLGFLINKKDLANEKKDEYLKHIQTALDQMKNLIEDLLQFSRIGANKDLFVEVDINNMLQSIQVELADNISQNNVEIIIHRLPTILANRTLLHELFMNLTSNALKYHKSDKALKIEIGYKDNIDKYEFFVKDNGIGIAPENLEKVFIMFKRLHGNSEYQGTGIGLALCQRIVDAHGGKIWVESVIGEGSTFFFTIAK